MRHALAMYLVIALAVALASLLLASTVQRELTRVGCALQTQTAADCK